MSDARDGPCLDRFNVKPESYLLRIFEAKGVECAVNKVVEGTSLAEMDRGSRNGGDFLNHSNAHDLDAIIAVCREIL